MREIKFRAWDKQEKVMWEMWPTDEGYFFFHPEHRGTTLSGYFIEIGEALFDDRFEVLQFTGLKDKDGLKELYEGDIIDTQGKVTGNIYEAQPRESDLVIQGFGTKAWLTTYQKAVDRGCKDSE